MNKWIKEFSKYINDQEIINYYEDEIRSLGTDNYFEICKEMGKPHKVAKAESKQNVTLDYKQIFAPENLAKSLFIILPLAIVFIYSFLTGLLGLVNILKTTNMLMHGANSDLWLRLLLSVAKSLMFITVAYICYVSVMRQIYIFNDTNYVINKSALYSAIILAIVSLICVISLGTNVNNFDKRHHIGEFDHHMRLNHKRGQNNK